MPERPTIDAVRALERFIVASGNVEHVLTFQGILRSHEELWRQSQEFEYGVVGPSGRMVNNGDYRYLQTYRRYKAGVWEPIPSDEILRTWPSEQ